MEPQKMDTRGEEKLQITYDAKIIVQLERDEDKKRKRAHEDVVRNNLSISSHILTHEYLYNRVTDILIILHMQISIMAKDEVQIQDNVIKRVDVEKDEDIKRADEEVMAIPQYNKPKKTNNANVLPEGETFSIISYFFIFGN